MAFLLLLAIVSDALALVSIAIWYPAASGYSAALALIGVAVLFAWFLRVARIDRIWLYLLTSGTLSWFACYWGGIQPALALVPIIPFLPHRPRDLDLFDATRPAEPRRFEHIVRYPVQVVLFFFGLVNGGVVLAGLCGGAAPARRPLLARASGGARMTASGKRMDYPWVRLSSRRLFRRLLDARVRGESSAPREDFRVVPATRRYSRPFSLAAIVH